MPNACTIPRGFRRPLDSPKDSPCNEGSKIAYRFIVGHSADIRFGQPLRYKIARSTALWQSKGFHMAIDDVDWIGGLDRL